MTDDDSSSGLDLSIQIALIGLSTSERPFVMSYCCVQVLATGTISNKLYRQVKRFAFSAGGLRFPYVIAVGKGRYDFQLVARIQRPWYHTRALSPRLFGHRKI